MHSSFISLFRLIKFIAPVVQLAPPWADQAAPPLAVLVSSLAVQIPWHLLLDSYPPMTIIIIVELAFYPGLPMFFKVFHEKPEGLVDLMM